ncbi:Alpha-ribazole phosphatase [Stutzerimonas frequens]|jgi:probable phosphoglycerate mutase|uniref:Histidine phosphatase family protein n=1 Tax=Stutzerimonas stutzeri TaxID=316 RepID=A0AA42KSG2_STUST|nr:MULTISPECIES: histidine phosphatase family protein [Pseudomonadaceae]MCH2341963.1 histidine phosphatase family protein [Pseudomonas sp.]MEC7474577.1 histidine phosphatase family protein [Pseudomonadota bacterium]MBH3356340.1 histidine phosphatase family protein [Stutzerimonas stutzeri]MBH3385877.1 histidine phosphatase family protein [Pseudomonas juntendi]MDH0146099.1 histidine phosphatase family protein [Stutzerimonas stutzeri]|tara:strand:- start:6054 stop:6815 length:762 start_codon:yes stop_codon:yes gene_type:complete
MSVSFTADVLPIHRRRVYLVRHGHVDYFDASGQPLDPRSVPLSAEGTRQVQALAELLAPLSFDRALCSDYPRARQTAELLLDGRGTTLEGSAALREVRAGRLREIALEQLQQRVCQAYANLDDVGGDFLGGERWDAFETRILQRFRGLLHEPDWQQLLIVSHDAVNRLLLGWALGGSRGCAAALEQDNACLNIIDIDMQGEHVLQRFVRVVNLTPYDLHKTSEPRTVMERIHAQIALFAAPIEPHRAENRVQP